MLKITMIILIFAMSVLLFYIIKSSSIWERLIAFNLISIKIIMMITVFAVYVDSSIALDISITYSIIGFISVTMFSRFLLKGGRLK